ncbi:nucleoporin nup188 [Anaeramoeba flamelloides]|uniref:Nucleoporin nup188 n=1 Tax=Anaeramoeba flamelloides TaxID=1746091 RepID=A0ABQ8YLI8_9EUKA|nr:nucleoporin nup188 [Anaeramoeba flamelloides]
MNKEQPLITISNQILFRTIEDLDSNLQGQELLKILKGLEPKFLKLLSIYTKPNQTSRNKLKNNEFKLYGETVSSQHTKLISMLSDVLTLNEEQTFTLLTTYFSLESDDILDLPIKKMVRKMRNYYFKERLSLINCFCSIISAANTTSHQYFNECKEFLVGLSNKENLNQIFLNQLKNLFEDDVPLPTNLTNSTGLGTVNSATSNNANKNNLNSFTNLREHRRGWADQLSKERVAILKCVFVLNYLETGLPTNEIMVLINVLKKYKFGQDHKFVDLLSERGRIETEKFGYLSMLLCLEILGPETLISTKTNQIGEVNEELKNVDLLKKNNYRGLDEIINTFGESRFHGPVIYCWSCFTLKLSDFETNEKTKKELNESFQLHWQRAYKNESLLLLINFLQSDHFLQENQFLKSLFQIIINGFLALVMDTIDIGQLPNLDQLFYISTKIYKGQKDLCNQFWTYDLHHPTLRSVFDLLEIKFPEELIQWFHLLTSLSTGEYCKNRVFEYLLKFKSFTQYLDLNDKTVEWKHYIKEIVDNEFDNNKFKKNISNDDLIKWVVKREYDLGPIHIPEQTIGIQIPMSLDESEDNSNGGSDNSNNKRSNIFAIKWKVKYSAWYFMLNILDVFLDNNAGQINKKNLQEIVSILSLISQLINNNENLTLKIEKHFKKFTIGSLISEEPITRFFFLITKSLQFPSNSLIYKLVVKSMKCVKGFTLINPSITWDLINVLGFIGNPLTNKSSQQQQQQQQRKREKQKQQQFSSYQKNNDFNSDDIFLNEEDDEDYDNSNDKYDDDDEKIIITEKSEQKGMEIDEFFDEESNYYNKKKKDINLKGNSLNLEKLREMITRSSLSRGNIVKTVLEEIEFAQHKYSFTIAFLDLMNLIFKHYLYEKSHLTDEWNLTILWKYLEYIKNQIFLVHKSWHYSKINQSWIISIKILQLFELIICDNNPDSILKQMLLESFFYEREVYTQIFEIAGLGFNYIEKFVVNNKSVESHQIENMVFLALSLLEKIMIFYWENIELNKNELTNENQNQKEKSKIQNNSNLNIKKSKFNDLNINYFNQTQKGNKNTKKKNKKKKKKNFANEIFNYLISDKQSLIQVIISYIQYPYKREFPLLSIKLLTLLFKLSTDQIEQKNLLIGTLWSSPETFQEKIVRKLSNPIEIEELRMAILTLLTTAVETHSDIAALFFSMSGLDEKNIDLKGLKSQANNGNSLNENDSFFFTKDLIQNSEYRQQRIRKKEKFTRITCFEFLSEMISNSDQEIKRNPRLLSQILKLFISIWSNFKEFSQVIDALQNNQKAFWESIFNCLKNINENNYHELFVQSLIFRLITSQLFLLIIEKSNLIIPYNEKNRNQFLRYLELFFKNDYPKWDKRIIQFSYKKVFLNKIKKYIDNYHIDLSKFVNFKSDRIYGKNFIYNIPIILKKIKLLNNHNQINNINDDSDDDNDNDNHNLDDFKLDLENLNRMWSVLDLEQILLNSFCSFLKLSLQNNQKLVIQYLIPNNQDKTIPILVNLFDPLQIDIPIENNNMAIYYLMLERLDTICSLFVYILNLDNAINSLKVEFLITILEHLVSIMKKFFTTTFSNYSSSIKIIVSILASIIKLIELLKDKLYSNNNKLSLSLGSIFCEIFSISCRTIFSNEIIWNIETRTQLILILDLIFRVLLQNKYNFMNKKIKNNKNDDDDEDDENDDDEIKKIQDIKIEYNQYLEFCIEQFKQYEVISILLDYLAKLTKTINVYQNSIFAKAILKFFESLSDKREFAELLVLNGIISIFTDQTLELYSVPGAKKILPYIISNKDTYIRNNWHICWCLSLLIMSSITNSLRNNINCLEYIDEFLSVHYQTISNALKLESSRNDNYLNISSKNSSNNYSTSFSSSSPFPYSSSSTTTTSSSSSSSAFYSSSPSTTSYYSNRNLYPSTTPSKLFQMSLNKDNTQKSSISLGSLYETRSVILFLSNFTKLVMIWKEKIPHDLLKFGNMACSLLSDLMTSLLQPSFHNFKKIEQISFEEQKTEPPKFLENADEQVFLIIRNTLSFIRQIIPPIGSEKLLQSSPFFGQQIIGVSRNPNSPIMADLISCQEYTIRKLNKLREKSQTISNYEYKKQNYLYIAENLLYILVCHLLIYNQEKNSQSNKPSKLAQKVEVVAKKFFEYCKKNQEFNSVLFAEKMCEIIFQFCGARYSNRISGFK